MAIVVWFAATAAVVRAEHVILLDGTRIDASVQSIDDQGHVQLSNSTTLEVSGIRRIDRTDKTPAKPVQPLPPVPAPAANLGSSAVVQLHDGSVLRAADVILGNQKCVVRWAFGDALTLPLGAVRAVQFRSAAGTSLAEQAAQFDERVRNSAADKDSLFAIAGGALRPIDGVVQELSDKQVVFVWMGQARPIDREKVYGFALAMTGKAGDTLGKANVALDEGSSLWGRITRFSGGSLSLELDGGQSVDLPWSSVRSVDIRSDRLAYLSDMDPTMVEQSAIVTKEMAWQRDRAVSGRPLKLADRTFSRGLGVHARCAMTYYIAGRFDVFAATIGIDAATDGKGDCEFVILADGREVYRQRVKGADKPRDVQLQVMGVDRLTLIVEPGEDLDLADHGDWCEARLIRNPERQ